GVGPVSRGAGGAARRPLAPRGGEGRRLRPAHSRGHPRRQAPQARRRLLRRRRERGGAARPAGLARRGPGVGGRAGRAGRRIPEGQEEAALQGEGRAGRPAGLLDHLTMSDGVYEIPQENRDFVDGIRAIVQRRVGPRAAEIDRTSEYPWDIRRAFGEADILALPFSEEYGGTGT